MLQANDDRHVCSDNVDRGAFGESGTMGRRRVGIERAIGSNDTEKYPY